MFAFQACRALIIFSAQAVFALPTTLAMSTTAQPTKSQINSLVYEQLLPGDPMMAKVRDMALVTEAERENVRPWIDTIVREQADGHRPVFIARLFHNLVGYMILKPRDQKISSIWVDRKFRGAGIAQRLYGMGFVNLGVSNPYTAFIADMIDEMRPLAQTYALVLDDLGPVCVLNPDDREPWATAAIGSKSKDEKISPIREQATRLMRQKIASYQG
jgi:hypothetical protein